MVGMQRVERLNLALSAGAAAAGYALVSPLFAASLAAGAMIETLNFHHMLRAGERLFAGQPGDWNGGFARRFALLGLALGGALWIGAHPVGLLVGVSLIMPVAVLEAWRNRPPIDPNAPTLAPDDPGWEDWNPWLAREIEADHGDVEDDIAGAEDGDWR